MAAIYGISALFGVLLGYLGFVVLRSVIPKKIRSQFSGRRQEMVQEASSQATKLKSEYAKSYEETLQIHSEEWEETLSSRKETLDLIEVDLDNAENSVKLEETRVQKIELRVAKIEEKLKATKQEFLLAQTKIGQLNEQVAAVLVEKTGENVLALSKRLRDQIVDDKTLESQRSLRSLVEGLEASQRREAERRLASALARYAPNFAWPKLVTTVEIADAKIVEMLAVPEARLLKDLEELTDELQVELKVDGHMPFIKLNGGFGMHKEAVRRALEELFKTGPNTWNKVAACYQKHLNEVERIAAQLGARACFELSLSGVHPKIQRLVGALNWRTSYRQNQWMHSLEVAKLAGIVASELGVDPDQAKRCGLLHDIGKALDYKIEGSHAVISGDYADRFGERKDICDTVMSHHNDLVIESPLAHVLKVADTLSGARPGARVNLEAGYQSRLSGIEEAINSFPGIVGIAIMNGGREVHVDVNNKRVSAEALERITNDIAAKIATDVAFPGQIKILVSRKFEAVAQA